MNTRRIAWARLAWILAPVLLLALAASPAAAEDGAGQDTKAKIKAKMEKILELMKANEKALIELSVGKDGKPKGVDVDVPPPESGASGGSAGGSGSQGGSSGSSGSQGGSSGAGEGAAGKLEELVKTMRSSGTIPEELKQLVEMIPT